jgi:hypothetical protein
MRIAARDVAMQRATYARVGNQHEGHGIGHEPARADAHEQAERVGADQRMLDVQAIFAQMGRLIHGWRSRGCTFLGRRMRGRQ